MSQGSFDPSKRRLCPDGACIGVIGDDGRCRVCGRTSDGSVFASTSTSPSAGDDLDTSDSDGSYGWGDDLVDQAQGGGGVGGDAPAPASASGGGSTFRPDRPLCDDGSCIGVIGTDGRCGVCGRAQGQ